MWRVARSENPGASCCSHFHSLEHFSKLSTHCFEILLEFFPLLALVVLVRQVLGVRRQLEFGTAERVLEDYGLLEGVEDVLL